jgi:hypothetical protein
MTSRIATLLAIAAMMSTGTPAALPFAPEPFMGRMCTHPAIPVPARNRDGRDCPGACHAACVRNPRGECDENDGD